MGELTPAAEPGAEAVEEVLCRSDAARSESRFSESRRRHARPSNRSRSAPHGTGVDRPHRPGERRVEEAIRVVTTGVYRDGYALVPFTAGDFFKLVIARSIVACLAPGDDRDAYARNCWRSTTPRSIRRLRCGSSPAASERPRAPLSTCSRTRIHSASKNFLQRFPRGCVTPSTQSLRSPSLVESRRRRARRRPRGQVHHARRRDLVRGGMPGTRLTILGSLAHAVPELSLTAVRDRARPRRHSFGSSPRHTRR